MKDKEPDVFAKAAERLYANGNDGQSTLREDTPYPVWFVEERQLNGEWLAIDRADDQDEAEKKLSHFENHLPGTYRLQR